MKKLLIIPIMLILLSFFVNADMNNYQTGNSIDNTYAQTGTGVWAGRTPVTVTYTGNFQSYSPTVCDIDSDGKSEIITLNNNNLELFQYVSGAGLSIKYSASHGSTNQSTINYKVTPYCINNSGMHIISTNITHMLDFWYNGTDVVLNQSVITQLNMTAIANYGFTTPVVKCASANNWHTAHTTCVVVLNNRSGSTGYGTAFFYDLTANTLRVQNTLAGLSAVDSQFHNLHLADGNHDGLLEAYISLTDPANGNNFVYVADDDASPTMIKLSTFNSGVNNKQFTDIIVNNLDGNLGNGLEITAGFVGAVFSYGDFYTIKATDGISLTSSYCALLGCHAASNLSLNMFQPADTTYTDTNSDVCYYYRNSATTDYINCVSRIYGNAYTLNEIPQPVTYTERPFVHFSKLTGASGILTNNFLVQGNTKESSPAIHENQSIIPVDAENTGSLDMIGLNPQTLTYYDDAYTNSPLTISSMSVNTGNDVCLNQLIDWSATYTDTELDAGSCIMDRSYYNDTLISETNKTFYSSPGSQTINILTTETGTFKLTAYCKDQYHTAYDTQTYILVVSNDSTTCRHRGEDPQNTTYAGSAETVNVTNDIAGSLDDAVTNLGFTSQKSKSILWMIIMLIAAGGTFLTVSQAAGGAAIGFYASLGVSVMMMILGWLIGFLTLIPLVLMSLFFALGITILIFGKIGSSPAG